MSLFRRARSSILVLAAALALPGVGGACTLDEPSWGLKATVGFELPRRAGREPDQPSSLLRNSSQGTPGSSPDRAACARRSISSVSSREMPAGASRESSSIAASSSRSSGGKAMAS
jgi:hypothetical protein